MMGKKATEFYNTAKNIIIPGNKEDEMIEELTIKEKISKGASEIYETAKKIITDKDSDQPNKETTFS